MAKITFNSTVKGTLTDLDVYIKKLIPVENLNGSYSIKYSDDDSNDPNFTIVYELTGMNGTDYTIEYTCLCDNITKVDPVKRSPVSGTIRSGNYKKETINIKCNQ